MNDFLLIAAATFASEDLTCIATGALIASGHVGLVPGVAACVAGIFAGDMLLYLAGRWIGRPLLQWKWIRRVLSEQKLETASRWLAERGAQVVVASRFTPGLRLPTYLAAGFLRTHFWKFAAYFLAAALVWTPILVGLSATLGEGLMRSPLGRSSLLLFPVIAVVYFATRLLRARLQSWRAPRRIVGWAQRKLKWEFWSPWAAYLPVVPYIVYLCARYRSWTLFTAANPGIPGGGFAGESKSQILSQLCHVPDFTLIPCNLGTHKRIATALSFLRDRGMNFPVVLKPDTGERGTNVVIARNKTELVRYLVQAQADTIVQRYVDGLEFGLFYVRHPREAKGRIFSITAKHFPTVIGDGTSTIEDLVWRDDRAVCLADLYLSRLKRSRHDVPLKGEAVVLAEVGSHCRGAVFLNGAHLETEALREAVDHTAKTHSGFFLGRFDVRTPSVAALQRGEFSVLELNGVTSEPTHIYDPSVSLLDAYRAMFTQWRMAFEIGAANREQGYEPLPLAQLAQMVLPRLARPLATGRIPQATGLAGTVS